MMNIQKICFRELKIPLKFRFSQSNNPSTKASAAVLLELQTDTGLSGFGESCPRTYVTGEDISTVQNDIQQFAETIKAQAPLNFINLRILLDSLEQAGAGNSTICALELAGLDLFMKSQGVTLSDSFGLQDMEDLSYSLILPLLSPEKMSGLFEKITHFQPPKIKLKVNQDQAANRERVRSIQAHFGQQIPIRVDVNGGWSLEEAMVNIPELAKLGVRSFEQILPVGQRQGLAQLNRQFGSAVRIMVDESLLSIQHARELIEQGCCNHFNLKISKLGGLFRSKAIYELATQNGIACQMGAHFGESNILATAGVVLAGLCPQFTAHEGAMSDFLLEQDLGHPKTRHAANGFLSSQTALDKVGWFEQIDLDHIDQNYTKRKLVL